MCFTDILSADIQICLISYWLNCKDIICLDSAFTTSTYRKQFSELLSYDETKLHSPELEFNLQELNKYDNVFNWIHTKQLKFGCLALTSPKPFTRHSIKLGNFWKPYRLFQHVRQLDFKDVMTGYHSISDKNPMLKMITQLINNCHCLDQLTLENVINSGHILHNVNAKTLRNLKILLIDGISSFRLNTILKLKLTNCLTHLTTSNVNDSVISIDPSLIGELLPCNKSLTYLNLYLRNLHTDILGIIEVNCKVISVVIIACNMPMDGMIQSFHALTKCTTLTTLKIVFIGDVNVLFFDSFRFIKYNQNQRFRTIKFSDFDTRHPFFNDILYHIQAVNKIYFMNCKFRRSFNKLKLLSKRLKCKIKVIKTAY
jgi:hypothetical protein